MFVAVVTATLAMVASAKPVRQTGEVIYVDDGDTYASGQHTLKAC